MARLISKIYGEALFDYAKEAKTLEKMCEEAIDIKHVFSTSKELKDFISNPKISTEAKVKFVREIFSEKFWVGKIAKTLKIFKIDITKGSNSKILDFLSIIIEKGRYKDIVPIFDYFIKLVYKEKNIGEAEIISAVELTDDKKNTLKEKLISATNYNDFEINYKIDETLIAGIKIKIGDKVFDKSYKTKIFEISKSLRGLKL